MIASGRKPIGLLSVALLGVVTIVLGLASGAVAQEKGSFRFAYLRLGWSATEIVHQEKLLEKRGWKVDWKVIDPIPGLITSFASGTVDVIDMSTILAGRMFEQGQKVLIFGATTGPTTYIIVPIDSPIKDVGDLKGRRLGAIAGSSAFQEINAYTRRLYNMDLTKDASLVTAMAPPDLAMLIRKGDVDAIVAWHPVADALLSTGKFRFIMDQDTLWKRSSGRDTDVVMVLYLTRPDFARKYPQLLKDINDAQREAVEMWRSERASQAIMAITGLPKDVVDYAMRNTKKMLYGLTEEHIDSMMEQLRLARQHGTILQSDIWTVPEKAKKVREELFLIPR